MENNGMTKAQVFKKAGLEYSNDIHGNQSKLAAMATKALNRASTTAAAVSANGGPAKITPTPAPRRVDRLDCKPSMSRAQSLHDAALQALKAGRHDDE